MSFRGTGRRTKANSEMYSIFIKNYAVLLTSLLVVMVSEIRKVASGKFSSRTGEIIGVPRKMYIFWGAEASYINADFDECQNSLKYDKPSRFGERRNKN